MYQRLTDKIAKPIFNGFPYLVILVLIFLLNKKCDDKKEIQNLYELENQEVQLYKNKLGTLTYKLEAIKLSEKNLKELILRKDDSLKILADKFHKIASVTKFKEVIVVDSVFVGYDVEIPCEFERFGKYDTDKWFSFNYALNQTGLNLLEITIPNQTTIITGTQKKWFLGKQTLITELTHTNPYVETTEMKTIVVRVEKKWYENQFLWFGAGVLGGIMVGK